MAEEKTTALAPRRLTAGLEPGWYEGVSAGEYHKWGLVSASKLQKLYQKTPAHLHYYLHHRDPDIEAGEKPVGVTDSLGFGTAVHTAVLEPERFERRYFPCPEGMRLNAAKGIAEWGELRARNPGKVGLRPDVWDACRAISAKLWKRAGSRAVLESCGHYETSFIAVDEETGCTFKGRPDAVSLELGATVDLKTCVSASVDTFSLHAHKFGYFRQGALYVRGMKALTGGAISEHVIIAVEKEPPHECVVGRVSAREIEASAKEVSDLLKLYLRCFEKNEWPGYPETMFELERSAYHFARAERSEKMMFEEEDGGESWMTSQLQ